MTTDPLHVYIIAGEPSGDALGGRLMRALKAETGGGVRFSGIGGPAMITEGLASLFPMGELTLFGMVEILPKAMHVLRRVRETAADILATRPDVVVTVDAPAFAFRTSKKIKGRGIPHVHYVAPTVWAWRPGRARMVAGFLTHLLALFPFEPPYFECHGLKTGFVGHSVVEGVPARSALEEQAVALRGRLGLAATDLLLVVLPGSRKSEVRALAPVFGGTLARLKVRYPHLAVVVPTVPNVATLVRDMTSDWPVVPILLDDVKDKLPAMAAARAALAASGTVALELALAEVPMVVAYKTAALSALAFRLMTKVRFANLINIMEDRAIVPELLQSDCRPDRLAAAVERLVEDRDARAEQIEAMSRVMHTLGRGGDPPSQRAARAILETVREQI